FSFFKNSMTFEFGTFIANFNLIELFLNFLPSFIFAIFFTVILVLIWKSTSSEQLNFNLFIVHTRQTDFQILQLADTEVIDNGDSTELTLNSSTVNSISIISQETVINRPLIIQAPSSIDYITPAILARVLDMDSSTLLSTTTSNSNNNSQNSTDQEQGEQQSSSSTQNEVNNSVQNEEINSDTTNTSSDSICVKIKFLDDSLKIVYVNKNSTVGEFKRSNFSEDLKAGKVIRLIYQGRLLRDDKATISSFGLTDQCVLHCHIGTRPYGTTTNNEPIGNENAQNSQVPPGPILRGGSRIIETIFNFHFNFVLAYVASFVRIVWEWSTRHEEGAAPQGTIASFIFHLRQKVRYCLSVFLDILIGPAFARQQQQQRLEDNQHNIGNLMALIVFVKFLLLWCFVIVYPQFTDRRSIFFLSMLTSTSGLYFYFSRANALQRQRTE
ncbi:Ubiquitin-like domain-containing protein, partial [Meloidogyne graminicola]